MPAAAVRDRGEAVGILTVDYETGWGERARHAIYSSRYAEGGALALDLTNPVFRQEDLSKKSIGN